MFRKILVALNFAKFRETLKKHRHSKKTFEKVRRNYFMKILLNLRKYVLLINVKIFEKKFENRKKF